MKKDAVAKAQDKHDKFKQYKASKPKDKQKEKSPGITKGKRHTVMNNKIKLPPRVIVEQCDSGKGVDEA